MINILFLSKEHKMLNLLLDSGWTEVESNIALSSPGVKETDRLNWDFLNFNLVKSTEKSIDSLLPAK